MSQLRKCKLDIKTLNETIARAALTAVQRQYGGEVIEVGGGWGIAFGWHAYFNVVRTVSGGWEFQYDDYATPIKFREFQNLFNQQYMAQTVGMALQQMGYQTHQMTVQEQNIVVRGVRMSGVVV